MTKAFFFVFSSFGVLRVDVLLLWFMLYLASITVNRSIAFLSVHWKNCLMRATIVSEKHSAKKKRYTGCNVVLVKSCDKMSVPAIST